MGGRALRCRFLMLDILVRNVNDMHVSWWYLPFHRVLFTGRAVPKCYQVLDVFLIKNSRWKFDKL